MRLFSEIVEGKPVFPRKFDLLILDEAHNVAPSGRGRYATDSLRTQALRRLAPHFEHKLFLSATPLKRQPPLSMWNACKNSVVPCGWDIQPEYVRSSAGGSLRSYSPLP